MAEDGGSDPIAEQSTRTPAPAPARRRAATPLPRGTSIGRYILIDVVGHGGMGVVYRAYDPELDRRIAIKLVREDRRGTSRLLEEAQALARVSHPNVVAVHDVGTFGDQVFIAMELVEGQTVYHWRAKAKPSRAQLLEVFLAAGRGLAAAHKAGIVHRDFKPSNVIVGDDGRVRVADFGLARAGDPTPGDRTPPRPGTPAPTPTPHEQPGDTLDTRPIAMSFGGSPIATAASTESERDLTSPTVDDRPPGAARDGDDDEADDPSTSLPRVIASRVMGTPSYMAPEQRRTGVYDARVDQYAFGVALYETLYNERPFAGANDGDLALNALAERVRPPPRGTDVPAHLRRTLLRALRADPLDRFPSMDALLDELSRDPARTRRRALAAVGAVLLVGLAAWGLASRHAAADPCSDPGAALAGAWDDDVAARVDKALRATGRPYAPALATRVAAALGARADVWTRVRHDACVAHADGDASDDLLDRQTACLDRRAAELRALTEALARGPDPDVLDHALDAVAALPGAAACADRDALLAIPPPADPEARRRVAALRAELAKVDAAVLTGAYVHANERAKTLVDDARRLGYEPAIAEALLSAGTIARRASAFAAAETYLGEAVQRAAAAHDDEVAAQAWVELVDVVGFRLARPVEGAALAKAADAAVARSSAGTELRARLYDVEALLASGSNQLDDAIARERAALALRERAGDDVATAESANDLALLLSERGAYKEAEDLHRRALSLRQHALGDSHPLVANSLDNLGVVVYHQGRLDEARQLYERALALRLAAFGPDAHDVGTSYNNLGGLYLDLGDDAKATDYLQRALAVWEKALGKDHPDLAIPLSNLGELANKRGDRTTARDLCGRALAIDSRTYGENAPGCAYDLVCVAEADLPDAPSTAQPLLERALALREKTPGDAGELARTRFDLARALAATGGDRNRAHVLAAGACQTFDSLGGTWTAKRDACTAWLATH